MERQPKSPEQWEKSQKLAMFSYALVNTGVVIEAFRQNGDRPFSMIVKRNENGVYTEKPMVIDEKFVNMMAYGTDRIFRELESMGLKELACQRIRYYQQSLVDIQNEKV